MAQKASLSEALPINGLRRTDYIGFVQVESKFRSNLTANFGVRYTFFDLFREANGKSNPFDFATCGPQGFCGVGASFGQRNYGDIDPRLTLAWSPAAAFLLKSCPEYSIASSASIHRAPRHRAAQAWDWR
jgi:outer membrane receptor protein involved in Fe transport